MSDVFELVELECIAVRRTQRPPNSKHTFNIMVNLSKNSLLPLRAKVFTSLYHFQVGAASTTNFLPLNCRFFLLETDEEAEATDIMPIKCRLLNMISLS
jgi:hypothetical protein